MNIVNKSLDIDEAKLSQNEFGLWLGWTIATAGGMLLGLLPFVLLLDKINLFLARIVIPLWAGLLIGILQLVVLRRYLTHQLDWVLQGSGWAIGYALGLVVIQIFNETPFMVLVGYILFGIIVGLIQWPIMRREIPSVFPWVAASIAGWALGAYLGQLALNLLAPEGPIIPAASMGVTSAITGLVAGAITGLALIWIVRQPEISQ